MKIEKKILILIVGIIFILSFIGCEETKYKEENLGKGIIFTKVTEDMKDHYILNLDGVNYNLGTDEHNTFSTSAFYKNTLYYTTKNSKGRSDMIQYDLGNKKSKVSKIGNEVDSIDTIQSIGNLLFLRVTKKNEHSMGLVKYDMDSDKYEFFNYDNADDMLMDFDVKGDYLVSVKYSNKEMQNSLEEFNMNKSEDKVYNTPPHTITVYNIYSGDKIYEKVIDEMVGAVTINNKGNKIAYIHSNMKEGYAKLTILDLESNVTLTPNINKGDYKALSQVRFGTDDNELYYIAETKDIKGKDGSQYNPAEVIKYDIEKNKVVEAYSTKDGLLKYFTIIEDVIGDKKLLKEYESEQCIEFTKNPSKADEITEGSIGNNPEDAIQVEDETIESDIKIPYTLEMAKLNSNYVMNDEEYINEDVAREFVNKVKNKKKSSIRYVTYHEGILSSMRDITYDGEKIFLREYFVLGATGEHYRYIEDEDTSIVENNGQYRLSNGAKLFYIKNNK